MNGRVSAYPAAAANLRQTGSRDIQRTEQRLVPAELVDVKNEPDNWRPYNRGGKLVTLKPDLFVITNCDAYEDRWFIEIDLATESPVRIIQKSHRYHYYYRSGLEQKQHGVFPLVVFIVPDAERKNSLTQHIKTEFSKWPQIIAVITPDELEKMMRQGAVLPK